MAGDDFTRRRAALAGGMLAWLASQGAARGQAQTHPGHAHEHGGAPASAGASVDESYRRYLADMDRDMSEMMAQMHAAPPSGNPDIDFLAMMIPHHAGAVAMARLALRDGRDPLVRDIAEKILAGQLTEIEAMQGRLAAKREGGADYPTLSGNRGT